MSQIKTKLIPLLNKLRKCVNPEDLFGLPASGDARQFAYKNYRHYAKMCHSDTVLNESKDVKEIAIECFQKLSELWNIAELRFEQQIYGDTSKKCITKQPARSHGFSTKKYEYTLTEIIHSGALSAIFHGISKDRKGINYEVIIRIPHHSDDNDLILNESTSLGKINDRARELKKDKDKAEFVETYLLRVPNLLESFELEEPGQKNKKRVNVFLLKPTFERGWYTFDQIRKKYPDGVDMRIAIFIWNRCLEALTFSHACGIIHGCLLPKHLMIHAEKHLGQIIDWTASVDISSRKLVTYIERDLSRFYPPEILEDKNPPNFTSDLYMLAMNMLYILGVDDFRTIRTKVPEDFIDVFNRCLQPKAKGRFLTANTVYDEVRRVSEKLYGPRKFIEFNMT